MQILATLAILMATQVATPSNKVEWRDSIRDVYVDGSLDRNVQTLTSSSPRMMAVVCGEEVLLLDPGKQAVTRAARSSMTFAPDRTSATTPSAEGEPAGRLTRTPTNWIAEVGGRSIVVNSHQSKAGPMTVQELWETAPVWRAIADVYEPDGAIVERLRAIDEPVTLQVVLATWCGDSRQHVPRLLKSVSRAANPNIRVELIGIDAEFLEPSNVVAGSNITNVPTVIVRNEAKELGRMVETPAAATVEEEVCDIFTGTVKPHPGRYERGAMTSSGTYVLRDARGRRQGTEVFETYERPGGGTIVHSVIARIGGTSIETWAAVDGERKPRFIEVTERDGRMTRTRYRREGEKWTAHSRGVTGIVDQNVAAPEAFVAPATVTWAWARGAERVYSVAGGAGTVRAFDARIGPGALPAYVRFSDGSSRVLSTR